jgi:hypothetical protein
LSSSVSFHYTRVSWRKLVHTRLFHIIIRPSKKTVLNICKTFINIVRENIILHRKPNCCEIFCCSLGVTKLSLKSTIVSIFRSEIIIKKLKLTYKYHQLFLEPGIWFDLFFKYIHMYIHVSIDWLIYCLIVYYVSITCSGGVCFLFMHNVGNMWLCEGPSKTLNHVTIPTVNPTDISKQNRIESNTWNAICDEKSIW